MGKKQSIRYDLVDDELDGINEDEEYADLDFNLHDKTPERFADDSISSKSTMAPRIRTTGTKKTTSRSRALPQMWDDDWQDPADDLMFGFDKD